MLRRYRQHRGDLAGGAKFFRGNKPIQLVYYETFDSRSDAQKRESEIKKYSKLRKEKLIKLITI
mgnify:CR=1 FL=1|tara:strand:- start:6759 stop:6950 length:192 start_codon:yes stop_codon:yes gene_type:complete